MGNKKWLIGIVVSVGLVAGALFLAKPNFFKGSLGGIDFGNTIGRQTIWDANEIMANILPPYQPEYEKLYPAYNGIRATSYLENIDFSLYANDGKIQGAGGSFSRRRPPSGSLASNWITILKYEPHVKQVMGDDVCPYVRGLSYAENHCTWMPVNPAHGELGKSFGRYVIFNFDTADKPSTLRGMVTIQQSPYRNDYRGDSAIEIFTVPNGGTRWDWQASCDKLASENKKECNFTLPEGYKAEQVVVARSFKYDHGALGNGVFGGTPYVWDIQIENVKIPDPKIMVLSRGVGGGTWTSREGAAGEMPRDGEIRIATIIGLDGKTYTQTIGLTKCLEDGTSGTKLEEVLKGKNRNAAEYIAGQVQKATGQKFLGKVEDLIQGKKGPGQQDIGMCDHTDRCKKAQDILNNAGGGLDAGTKVGGKDRSWMSEGGEASPTDEADKAAKEQIQATKDLPAAEKVAKEAQEQADKLRQDRDNAVKASNEANAQKQAAQDSYNKAVKDGNATKILVEEKRLAYAREEAKKAADERTRQESGTAISDRQKAEREAAAAAERATALKRKATGDDTACSAEDDRCLDKKAVAQLQKNISKINQFVPPGAQIDLSGKAGLPLKVTSSGVIGLDKNGNPIRNNDPLINPNLDAQTVLTPPAVPKTKFEKCLFQEQKVIPLGNPGEEGFQERCFEDCAPADVAIGQACGQDSGPQKVPVGTCGQNVFTKNQQGAIDCAQDDFECERNKHKKVANCQDGFPPRLLCGQGAVAVYGCPERDSGLCRGVGGRPPSQ